jgi:hypothetical protein
MPGKQDFERAWLAKFSTSLAEIAGEEIRNEVIRGSEGLSSDSDRQEVIAWSRAAMARLESLVDQTKCKQIMNGCACRYPESDLLPIREAYTATKDIDIAHQMLQAQFVSFLEDTLQLSDEHVKELTQRGWGSAGVRQGNSIVATKIPKSGNLLAYMAETDPVKKRQYYCHCPRVRDALRISESLSPTYCNCGAGFYKGIWEVILQQSVEVDVLETVLAGGQVCRFAIHLPPNRQRAILDEIIPSRNRHTNT